MFDRRRGVPLRFYGAPENEQKKDRVETRLALTRRYMYTSFDYFNSKRALCIPTVMCIFHDVTNTGNSWIGPKQLLYHGLSACLWR